MGSVTTAIWRDVGIQFFEFLYRSLAMKHILAQSFWVWHCMECHCANHELEMPDFNGQVLNCQHCFSSSCVAPVASPKENCGDSKNSAEKTQPCGETNKRMVKLLSDIQNSVQQRNNCLIIKESAMFEEINAVLAQQNHAS
jgi:hypothetical protein